MDEKQFYESVAAETNLWELDHRHNRYFQDMIRYDKILQFIPKDKKLRVLDLGCGDGFLSYFMARAGHQVTGLDLSETRLAKFREIAEQYHIEQKIGDVKQTGLPDAHFDLVVSSEVLEHIEGYADVVLEARRVLKPGAHFIITVPHDEPAKIFTCPHCLKQFYRDGHVNRFNRKNLPQALLDWGFKIAAITVMRSKILNQIQYHLKLKYGFLVKLYDRILCALLPKYTMYLLVVGQKENT